MTHDPFEGWERLSPPGRGHARRTKRARLDRRGQLSLTAALCEEMSVTLDTWAIVYLHRLARRVGLRLLRERQPDAIKFTRSGSRKSGGLKIAIGATLRDAGWVPEHTIPPGAKSVVLDLQRDAATGLWWFQLPPKALVSAVPAPPDAIRQRLRRRLADESEVA